MAKAKTKKKKPLSNMGRRKHLGYILAGEDGILKRVKKACGSSWNEGGNVANLVNGHMSEALSYAEKLSCGSVWTESLPEISKLIREKDEEGINEAVSESMEAWLKLFTKTHKLAKHGNWNEFQVVRCRKGVALFESYLASVVSPVTKDGKQKKRGEPAKASEPKAEPKAKKAKPDALEARVDGLEAGQAEILAAIKELRS